MNQGAVTYVHSRRKRIWLTLYAMSALIAMNVAYGLLYEFSNIFSDEYIANPIANFSASLLGTLLSLAIWLLGLALLLHHLRCLLGARNLGILRMFRAENDDWEISDYALALALVMFAPVVILKIVIKYFDLPNHSPEFILIVTIGVCSRTILQSIAAIWARADEALPQRPEGAA